MTRVKHTYLYIKRTLWNIYINMPHWVTFDEHPQHTFSWTSKKISLVFNWKKMPYSLLWIGYIVFYQHTFLFSAEANGGNSPASVTLSQTNLIAIIASVIAVVIALGLVLAFFIIRHKRLQRSFRAFASSHYDSRSGTTTFSADELGT